MSSDEFSIPNDDAVSPADIRPNVSLSGADLSEADLHDAVLSRADLSEADLSGADLSGADLSEADLHGADLSEAYVINADLSNADLSDADLRRVNLSSANLYGANLHEAFMIAADLKHANLSDTNIKAANLSGADLTGVNISEADLHLANLSEVDLHVANLSEADLSHTDLSGADLRGSDLSHTDLRGSDLSGVTLNRQTEINRNEDRILTESGEKDPTTYDQIARVHHKLREAYSVNGLIGRARTARVRERKARRREAFAEGGGRGYLAWFWSVLSQVFTGYGIQLRWIVVVILTLYFGSALVYWEIGGMAPVESLYYSVVTFTTSPPDPAPTGLVMRTVAGIETFAGTATIIFLGYVLSTRERV